MISILLRVFIKYLSDKWHLCYPLCPYILEQKVEGSFVFTIVKYYTEYYFVNEQAHTKETLFHKQLARLLFH